MISGEVTAISFEDNPSYASLKNLLLKLAKEKGIHVSSLIQQRKEKGFETYKKPLTTNNGRDALQDCLEELADGLMYYVQYLLEQYEKEQKRREEQISN